MSLDLPLNRGSNSWIFPYIKIVFRRDLHPGERTLHRHPGLILNPFQVCGAHERAALGRVALLASLPIQALNHVKLSVYVLLGLFGHDESSVLLLHELVGGHHDLGVVLADHKLLLALRQQRHLLQLMQQIQILRRVLSALVDPGQHLLDLVLLIHFHELGALAREIMTVDLCTVEDRRIALRLFLVVASYLIDHVVEVEVAHVLLEVLDSLRRPPLEHLLSVDVNQGAVS